MLRISSLNLLLSSGTLTPSLAEPAIMLIIHLISPRFNSMTPQPSIPITSHTSSSILFLLCITASYSHSSLLWPLHRQNQENLYYSSQYYKLTLPSILGSSLLTYHLESWNSTGSSSRWQLTKMKQFLTSLEQCPSASPQLVTTLQLELSNIQDLYKSHETLIMSAMNLLNSNQPQPPTRHKRSLLPFLGTALSWLMGTATTKDIRSIRTRINQIIATQSSQCDTLVHIVSMLIVTRYATQVNRHSINSLMDAVHSAAQDINNLFNVTSSLASSINFNQMTLHLRSVFANLWDTMQYLHTISTHTMDYIDAATSSKLSPHVLPVVDLQQMLPHIAATLPPTLHLPISPMDTLHFYRYLRAHVLIENKQFLLLIDIPIQDTAQQITIHQVLTLDIPHGNYSAHYDINTQYFGVTTDATMGLELSHSQFKICKQANGQFYHISTPFQPLANPPTCIAMLYAKSKANIESKCSLQLHKALTTPLPTQITPDVWILANPNSAPTATVSLICPEKPLETIPVQWPLHVLKLPTACSATLANFYLPPRYETPALNVNVSLGLGKHTCY